MPCEVTGVEISRLADRSMASICSLVPSGYVKTAMENGHFKLKWWFSIVMWVYQRAIYTGWWFQPLWKVWKSIGMIIPNIWENKSHVPVTTNHQPVVDKLVCHGCGFLSISSHHLPRRNWSSFSVCFIVNQLDRQVGYLEISRTSEINTIYTLR